MATDMNGNPAEQGAVARLGALMKGLTSAGVQNAPVADESVALVTAKQLKQLTDSEQGSKLAADVSKYYSQVKAARTQYEHVWLKNLDMAQGRQFTEWDKNVGKMVQTPAPDYEPRVVVNVIEPVMRTALAKTGGSNPTATVAPASNEDSDLMAAEAAEQLWDWDFATSKFQTRAFSPANFWAAHTGNGFVKTYYDQSCTDEAATAAAQKTTAAASSIFAGAGLEGAFGDPTAPPTQVPQKPVLGKIRHVAVSPFHLYVPDLSEPDIEEQPYVIHAYPMNKQKAINAYQKFVGPDWQPASQTADTILSSYRLGIPGGNTAMPDTVIVKECWIKPGINPNLPKGGVVIQINDTIVGASDGWPYSHGEYPFAHITGIETGVFYRKSVIGTMIPLQNEINRTYAQIIKHRNLALKPMMMFDAGSLDPRKIQSKAGTWIPVALGANRPTALPITDLSAAFWNLLDKFKTELDNITGQHDVSRSTSPGADTAASAISVLQEADNNFLYSWFESIEATFEKSARHFLALAVQFWDKPRLIKIVGDDGSYNVQELVGSDIAMGTDIRIERGTGLPEGKAARIALITDWMKNGFIPVDEGMKALEMGTLGKVYRLIKIDEDQATRENLDMKMLDVTAIQQQTEGAAGADPTLEPPQDPSALFSQINEPDLQQQSPPPVADPMAPDQAPGAVDPMTGAPAPVDPMSMSASYPINSFDNDAIHIAVHQREMKGQAYKGYAPEIKQVFEEHVAAHQARMGQMAAQQQQAAALAAGGAMEQEKQGTPTPGASMQDQGAGPGALQ
jgi:hypothetical protein